jgi:hypothetical protein
VRGAGVSPPSSSLLLVPARCACGLAFAAVPMAAVAYVHGVRLGLGPKLWTRTRDVWTVDLLLFTPRWLDRGRNSCWDKRPRSGQLEAHHDKRTVSLFFPQWLERQDVQLRPGSQTGAGPSKKQQHLVFFF